MTLVKKGIQQKLNHFFQMLDNKMTKKMKLMFLIIMDQKKVI